MARDAAACALEYGDPARAVEFLEHGRGILISDLLRDIQDETILSVQRPDLAGRLQRAEAELAALNAGEQPGTASRRQQLAADRSAAEQAIASAGQRRRRPALVAAPTAHGQLATTAILVTVVSGITAGSCTPATLSRKTPPSADCKVPQTVLPWMVITFR